MTRKYTKTRLFIITAIIALGWGVITYLGVSSRVATLTHEKYVDSSREMKEILEIFIHEKQEITSLLSLTLAQSYEIKKVLRSHNDDLSVLPHFSQEFRNKTPLKNIWIQLIEPNGKSLYRSWSPKKGDNISEVRPDIAKVIKEQKAINSISVGIYDLTFKSIIPIYDNNTFIGLVETLSKFNSIAIKMQKKGFDTLALVDKAYKHQFLSPFTNIFVDDYYIANLGANKELMHFVEKKSVEYFINNKDYCVTEDINKLITVFYLNDINNNPMSYFLLFNDLSNIDLSSIDRIRNRLILGSVLSLLLLLSCFYYLYIKRYKTLLDTINKKLEHEVFSKTKELEEQNKKLNHIAHHDLLTALPNRLLFLNRLEQSIKLAKRHKTQVSVMFLDLNQFKEVNDTCGHASGDQLLQEIAQRLKPCVRQNDTIARLGGDEFTIIIEGLENENIVNIIQKIIDSMKDPFFIAGHTFYTSFSIGISSFPEDGDSADILLRNADIAMYKAKEHGRNTYEFYRKVMSINALKKSDLGNALRHAIENNDFEAYYQPKINALTNKVIGMEALIRWHDTVHSMIPPDEFIPLAEELGLISKIDEWMMEETLKTALAWQKEGLFIGKISLNLSMKQLEDKDFIGNLKNIIRKTEFNPKFLELEITESQIMKNPETTINVLNAIKALGVTISIDDFGTGHSSLAYLKWLPVDKLKIDRSFIQEIPNNEDDMAIVKAIIVLAKSLKLDLIAEGVETIEQKDFLVDLGCSNIQGYFYSKPLPADAYRDFLIKHS